MDENRDFRSASVRVMGKHWWTFKTSRTPDHRRCSLASWRLRELRWTWEAKFSMKPLRRIVLDGQHPALRAICHAGELCITNPKYTTRSDGRLYDNGPEGLCRGGEGPFYKNDLLLVSPASR
jgi:hypothetical protein